MACNDEREKVACEIEVFCRISRQLSSPCEVSTILLVCVRGAMVALLLNTAFSARTLCTLKHMTGVAVRLIRTVFNSILLT